MSVVKIGNGTLLILIVYRMGRLSVRGHEIVQIPGQNVAKILVFLPIKFNEEGGGGGEGVSFGRNVAIWLLLF